MLDAEEELICQLSPIIHVQDSKLMCSSKQTHSSHCEINI